MAEDNKHLVNQPGPDEDPNAPPGGGTPGEGPADAGEPGKPGEGEPTPKPGEGDKDYTDEELAELIQQDEAEWLESQGLGKFKSVDALVKSYKDLEGTGTKVFTAVKRIGEHYKMTPDELIDHLDSQLPGGTPVRDARDRHAPAGKEPAGTQVDNAEIKRLTGLVGRTNLDRLFDKWQVRKEVKEKVDVPDSIQGDLEGLLPLIAGGATEEELKGRDLFEEAYQYHTYRQEKRKGAGDRTKHKLDQKKKQLGVPGGRSATATPDDVTAANIFGFEGPP